MAASKVLLISRKIIKPSSPTPSSLRSYKLSYMDQLSCNKYMPLASFYPNQHHQNNSSLETNQTIPQVLEESLSKLLKWYYPFAGTQKENISINCNDGGVTFLEARINSSMAAILQEHDSKVQHIVFPRDLTWNNVDDKNMLVVAQLNHFECGGKALGLCMSHKLGDASTLARFMSDWAAIARQSSEEPSPQFIGASVSPPKDASVIPVYESPTQECVGTRFAFNGKKIAQLKALVSAESGVQNPTRVEIVTAFLCKSAMAATSIANSQSVFTPSLFTTAVNLRRLIVPSLASNSVGNFYSNFFTPIVDEGEMKLSRLVSKIRKSKLEFYEKCKQKNLNELLLDEIQNLEKYRELGFVQGMNFYSCTSMCGFPSNNLDFGWGRPIKVALGTLSYKNLFMLMDDNNGDGVEAIVTLDENIMSVFQSDKELQAFASPYKSIHVFE